MNVIIPQGVSIKMPLLGPGLNDEREELDSNLKEEAMETNNLIDGLFDLRFLDFGNPKQFIGPMYKSLNGQPVS
jgi:hypothetical protein